MTDRMDWAISEILYHHAIEARKIDEGKLTNEQRDKLTFLCDESVSNLLENYEELLDEWDEWREDGRD